MGLSGYFNLTAGDFLQFTMFMVFMIAPIVQMSNIGSQLTEAFAGLDRTEELMNMPVEDDGTTRTVQIGNVKGDFEFKDVSFAYEEGKPVLKIFPSRLLPEVLPHWWVLRARVKQLLPDW